MEIYEPKGRAREYSPLALNYYKGCSHGCLYCYVPKMIGRFNSEYNHGEVQSDIDIDKIERSAKRLEGCGKQILLSFTGDPYCGVNPEATTEVLKVLNKYNHKVAILTKGGSRALEDIEIIKSFGERIKIGATLVFDNDNDSLKWEPGAALPQDRIEALRELKNEGIKTWVSFEPVIVPSQSLNLLSRVDFVDHVKIGKINNYNNIDKGIDWDSFIFDAVKICRENGVKFYIKKDLLLHNTRTILKPKEIDMDALNL